MFTVGATTGRPQTTAKPKRATNGRPYKQISAENLFSLPICVIMGYIVGRGQCLRSKLDIERSEICLHPAAMKDLVLGNGGTKAPPYKGYGLCPTRCNTNAKLAR